MSYYEKHVFICTNQRTNGEACCQDYNADELRAYAKDRVNELGLSGHHHIRINKSGCLDRCSEGPVMVVYPEGTWYWYENKEDIDEIITSHLQNNKPVERLILKNPAESNSEKDKESEPTVV